MSEKISLATIKIFLTSKEMKNVMGGSGVGDCKHEGSGTCGWKSGGLCYCGISYGEVQSLFDVWGGNWCCDSCDSSSYCV